MVLIITIFLGRFEVPDPPRTPRRDEEFAIDISEATPRMSMANSEVYSEAYRGGGDLKSDQKNCDDPYFSSGTSYIPRILVNFGI